MKMKRNSIVIQSITKYIHGYLIYIRLAVIERTKHKIPVVLVHGLSTSSRYMIPIMYAFAPYHPVYAPDLSGFGRSDKPSHVLTIDELAELLMGCMQALGLKKIILLGNSLGCQIIVAFALKYPEYVSHIILIGPTADPKARTYREALKGIVVDLTREPFSYLLVISKEYLDAGIRRTLRTIKYGFHYKLEEKVADVLMPVLIIRGERDAIVSQEWVEKLQTLFPHGSLVTIKKAAHVVHFSAPHKVVTVVRTFLDEVS